jgi:beta-carotene hydroxylase
MAVLENARSTSPEPGSDGDGDGKDGRITVQREWIGAPAGTLTNPTCWLAVLVVGVLSGATWSYLAGNLSAWGAIALNALAMYIGFTVLHESMHGIAHSNRTVNAWLGRPMALLLSVSAPMFRRVHFEHHSHTNDPQRDPDLFVSRGYKPLLPLWVFGVVFEYRRHYYGRKLWRSRAELAEALGVELLLVALPVAALISGHFAEFIVVWAVPSALAVMWLAITFDYLPHYPFDSRERYYDTRVYPGRAGFVILLGQNYHLIHHLWTTIPWYRLATVFESIRPQLEERGVRIGWRVERLPVLPIEEAHDAIAPRLQAGESAI